MNTSILLNVLALVTFTSAAQASSFDVDCSNANGTVISKSGHRDNYVQLTQWIPGGQQPVRFERGEVHQKDTLKSVNLITTSRTGCEDGREHGVASRHSVEAAIVTFVRNDGGLFDENFIGVSKDRKTVKAEILCETNITSLVMCPKK